MTIRDATPGDKEIVLELVQEFEAELPPLPYPEDTPEEDWLRIEQRIREGIVLLAEEDGRAVGFADAEFEKGRVVVVDLYVREEARRRGIATDLLAGIADAARVHGLTDMELKVESRNVDAIRFYERLGFEEGAKVLRITLDTLRSGERDAAASSTGAVHAQTDDADSVQKVVDQFLPRLARHSAAVVERGRAWTAVRVEPFSRDVLRKLGVELSYRFGVSLALTLEEDAVVRFVLHDQGRMVDEYLSVPEYYGPLPPGDALALRANPTVVARLTGAEPARVRAVARTAQTLGELPPAAELYGQIAELLGLQP